VSALECGVCGLAECDLPDCVDPEMFFEVNERGTHCPTCPQPQEWADYHERWVR